MKNMNANLALYTIDYAAKKIMSSTRFIKLASIYDSPEYRTLKNLRTDLPNFEIEVVEEKKKKAKSDGLTLDYMEAFIENEHGIDSKELKEFQKVREDSKVKGSGRYSFMKKWFHEVYPEGYALVCKVTSKEIKRKESMENARKVLNTALALSQAGGDKVADGTKENSAESENSAEE